MSRNGKYPDELRERAVRMVLDHGHEYGSQWEAICSVADKLGSADRGPRAETVRLWVRQAEKDTGRRPKGKIVKELKDEVIHALLPRAFPKRSDTLVWVDLKRLKRENAELRRANDILKAAATFFGAELDRQSKR